MSGPSFGMASLKRAVFEMIPSTHQHIPKLGKGNLRHARIILYKGTGELFSPIAFYLVETRLKFYRNYLDEKGSKNRSLGR